MLAISSILLFTGCGHLSFGNVAIKHNKECIYILYEAQLTSLEISGGPDVVVENIYTLFVMLYSHVTETQMPAPRKKQN